MRGWIYLSCKCFCFVYPLLIEILKESYTIYYFISELCEKVAVASKVPLPNYKFYFDDKNPQMKLLFTGEKIHLEFSKGKFYIIEQCAQNKYHLVLAFPPTAERGKEKK